MCRTRVVTGFLAYSLPPEASDVKGRLLNVVLKRVGILRYGVVWSVSDSVAVISFIITCCTQLTGRYAEEIVGLYVKLCNFDVIYPILMKKLLVSAVEFNERWGGGDRKWKLVVFDGLNEVCYRVHVRLYYENSNVLELVKCVLRGYQGMIYTKLMVCDGFYEVCYWIHVR